MTAFETPVLVWPILLPLLCAALAFVAGPGRALTVCVLTCLVGVPLGVLVVTRTLVQEGVLRHTIGAWEPPLGIVLYADGLSALMLLLSAAVGTAISVFAIGYLRHSKSEHPPSHFWALWFFTWAGVNALFLSGDIFNLYVCLEIVTLAVIPLIVLSGTTAAWRAALRYLLLALLGSMCYLLGVGLLYSRLGSLDIAALTGHVTPGLPVYCAIGFMLAGLLLKCGLFPLHIWLPPAHASAPAPVSAMLSGLVVTAGYYMILRLWFSVFTALPLTHVADLLGLLGSGAILWGGAQAIRQSRLKLLIAYSTVSQIGYLFLVFPLTGHQGDGTLIAWTGAAIFALSHGLAKAAAFLAAGVIALRLGHDRIADLRGCGARMPLTCAAFAIAGVNLMGLPPSGGFAAKWMLLNAAFLSGMWGYGLVIVVGGALAFCYIFRVLEQMMSNHECALLPAPVPRAMPAAALTLALIAVTLSLYIALPMRLLAQGTPAALTAADTGSHKP